MPSLLADVKRIKSLVLTHLSEGKAAELFSYFSTISYIVGTQRNFLSAVRGSLVK